MLWTCYFDWLPLIACLFGVFLAIRGFARRKNLGFLLLALLFVPPAYTIVAWWVYAQHFVQVQVGPNTWTAPVRQVDILSPLLTVALLAATWLLARSGEGTIKPS